MLVHIPNDTPLCSLLSAMTSLDLTVESLDIQNPEIPEIRLKHSPRAKVIEHPTIRRIAEHRARLGR